MPKEKQHHPSAKEKMNVSHGTHIKVGCLNEAILRMIIGSISYDVYVANAVKSVGVRVPVPAIFID